MSFCGLRIYLSRITSNRWDQSATKLRMYKSLLIIRLFIESNEWQWYPVLQLQQKKFFEASVHIWRFPGFPMKGNGWAFMVKNWGYGWSEYAIRWSTFIIKWPYPSLPYEENLIVAVDPHPWPFTLHLSDQSHLKTIWKISIVPSRVARCWINTKEKATF